MTNDQKDREEAPPPAVLAQEPPPADTPDAGDEHAAPTALDPFSRSTLVAGLQAALHELGIDTRDSPPNAKRTSWFVVAKGGGLTQQLALREDPGRRNLYAWYWLWNDGLRGEGPTTPEYMCPGEDIQDASMRVARVLGVNPVAM